MPNPTIRPRLPIDLPSAAQVLKHVYATDGYPVEGVPDPIAFLTPPATLCAWVAEISPGTGFSSESDSDDRIIVGHALVTAPAANDPGVKAWTDRGGTSGEVAILQRLFVDGDARGCGTGEKLTLKAMEWARGQGKRLVLLVLDKDRAAMRLYERLRWRSIGDTEYENANGERFQSYLYLSPRQSE